jgi:hypothetical protein
MWVINIDRDSVHAGDDLESHGTSIEFDPTLTLRKLFEAIRGMGYLPAISGGKATWIICSSGKHIGVLAQQWPEPKLTIPAESILSQYFADSESRLLFKYWCQVDPEHVFSQINAGHEPPPRF